jgi:hypothetical protein
MQQWQTERKRSEQLRRGDVLWIKGSGAYAIKGFQRLGDGRVLALLAWRDLAVILRRGQEHDVVTGPARPGAAAA